MPYRTIRSRAPLFMTHKGTKVYHVFRHDDADILSSFKGMPKDRFVELLAKATKTDLRHSGFTVQVVCSAWGNEPGLNPFDGPRNRSARPGYRHS